MADIDYKCNICLVILNTGYIFSPTTGKYGPEMTPYLDTFHAVSLTKSQSEFDILSIEMKQTERDNYCICLDSRRLRVYTSPQLMKMMRHYLSLMQQKIAV